MTQPASQGLEPPVLLVVAPTWRELGGLQPGRMGFAQVAEVGIGHTAVAAFTRLLDQGLPQLVISLGFAGAVAGGVPSGSIVVCTSFVSAVNDADAPIEADVKIAGIAKGLMPNALAGALLTVPTPLLTPGEKLLAGAQTGAVVVDMEGYGMAKAAQEHGVEFLGLRAVLDTVDLRLPQFVADIIADGGRNEWRHSLSALAKRPYLAPQVISLALLARRAQKNLTQALIDTWPGIGSYLSGQSGQGV